MEDKEADAKTPLTYNGLPSEPVDYNAVFANAGDERREEFAKETVLGECRNPRRLTCIEWLFMAVSSLSLLGVLSLSIERLVFFEQSFVNLTTDNGTAAACNSWICTSDFIFAIALLVNLGFCVFYCFDGLFRERPFEILAYAAAVTVVVVYIIGNYIVQGLESQPLRLVRLVFVVLFGPVNVVLALGSWWKMGYFILNVIGTNTKLVRAYQYRSFFQTLQLFNVEVLCNIVVLAWYRNGEFLELWERIVIFLLLFFSIIVTLIGGIAILWEVHVFSIIWYALIVPCGLYYIYRIVMVTVNINDYYAKYTEYLPFDVNTDSIFVATALIFACVFGLLVVILMIVFMILSQMNYGKGLKNKVHPPLYRYINRT